jgi:poly(A) polymerase/tRNA nucleotidyltransferase (CCA-adding enzyme)
MDTGKTQHTNAQHTARVRDTLRALHDFCAAQGVDAWLVGGTTRDLLRGHTPNDLDLAVAADGVALARQFADAAGGAFVALDDERGTGRVVLIPSDAPRLTVDLVQLRAPTLAADLRLRDFTINAMALPLPCAAALPADPAALRRDLLDPCGGLEHLEQRTLRLCQPTSLHDDPARTLRAFRFAAALGLRLAPELEAVLREAVPLVGGVAAERVRDELLKLLALPGCAPWLRQMDGVGLLTAIFPELEPARACDQPIIHFLPVLEHVLEAVACIDWLLVPLLGSDDVPPTALPVAAQTHPGLPRSLPYTEHLREHMQHSPSASFSRAALLKLATLLHDNAKPQTKQPKAGGGVTFYGHPEIGADVAYESARRLRLSRQAASYIALVAREHMRPGQLRAAERVTPRAVARFFRDTDPAGPDVLLHELADHLATRGPMLDPEDWRNHLAWSGGMLDALWGAPPERRQPLLNGHDLINELGLEPGKLVGDLLREIHEAQAAGEIDSREQALDLARRHLAAQR